MEKLNEFFTLINLKAFCAAYRLNYEFTRQVLLGRRPLTEKFRHSLTEHIAHYQARQQEILTQLT